MSNKIKNHVVIISMALLVAVLSALCFFGPKADFLDAERRAPAAFPELSAESIMKDGTEYKDSFMSMFESYSLDNFPFRDFFRTVKAICANFIFGQLDNNNIFITDGYAAEMQESISEDSIAHAADRLNFIYEKYLKEQGIRPYISIIPDKAYFTADKNGHLSMDYEEFVSKMTASVPFAEYIDIFPTLSLEDYYKTDSHWRQEQLGDTAQLLVESMGAVYGGEFAVNRLDYPFYGVYYGQAALPMPAENMYYLTSPSFENLKVYDHQNRREMSVYDMEKAVGKDPYDMYLAGELYMVTIENPNALTNREVIIFRDSFGRSIIPLMADSYAKITVVDIRYLSSVMLGGLIDFEGQDVLFLYSTLVLNQSSELK